MALLQKCRLCLEKRHLYRQMLVNINLQNTLYSSTTVGITLITFLNSK